MDRPLDILILEDVATDADLALRELHRAGLECRARRVETEDAFRQALAGTPPDLILSDFALPSFDGLSALAIARSACPDTPFIFVSGHIGEEMAIEALKHGATDYVLKGNLKRLAPVVQRAVEEAAESAARARAEHELRASEARFRLLIDGLKDYALYMVDPLGRVTTWNAGGERLTGYHEEEVLGRHFSCFFPPEEIELGKPAEFLKAATAHGRVEEEGWRLKKDGSRFWANVVTTALRSEDGQLIGFARIVRDITERKNQEAQLVYLATHDCLTGLPNRNLLEDRLAQAIAHAQRLQRPMAVVFVDLDRFKLVNDTLGHDKGDLLLKIVGHELAGAVRVGDTVARSGGDEFVIVMSDLAHEDDVSRVVDKLTASLSRPFSIAGHDLYASASIGVALYPKDGETVQDLLRNADTAMFRAKESGKGQHCFYSPEMDARIADRLALESRLRRAVELEQFVLHYQPKLDMKTRRISGLEALLRWNDPEAGLLPPARFIPILEETGMIIEAGRWAMERAVADYIRWRALGLAPPQVAVNVSAVQLRQGSFVDMVVKTLERLGETAPCLGLEITESLIIEDFESSIGKLRHLRNMGLEICIDDFGTGHSSLNYISRLPVDALKIDRSFVVGMAADPTSMAIVSAIISLAHSLDLKVVAEGVETEEQANLLRLLKCDEMQGYLCSPPVPAQRIEEMLGDRRGWK